MPTKRRSPAVGESPTRPRTSRAQPLPTGGAGGHDQRHILEPDQLREDLVTSLQKQFNVEEDESGEATIEKADAPVFDRTNQDDFLQQIKAAGMTTPQSLPKG